MGRVAAVYCAAMLLAFAWIAYAAAARESATYDEPLHVSAAWAHFAHGEFGVEPDHPPLWKYWVALGVAAVGGMDVHVDSTVFRDVPRHVESEWPWCVATVYFSESNDPSRVITAGRVMMLLCAVGLGAVVGTYAWRAAGPGAACVAVTLFSLDPNFLAHGPLVKNDVAQALCLTALGYHLWRGGGEMAWWRVAVIGLLCVASVGVKMTGVLAGPMVAGVLVARSLMSDPWTVAGRRLETRTRRLGAAAGVCVVCLVMAYGGIWGMYRFRFDPSPDPSVHFDIRHMFEEAPDAVDGLVVRTGVWALDHRVLPESFVVGLLYGRSHVGRPAYLLGETYRGARWDYFPVVIALKTPVTTLAVMLWAVVAWAAWRDGASRSWLRVALGTSWLLIVVGVMAFPVNIGVRHALAVYPLAYVMAGVVASRLWPGRRHLATGMALVLWPALVAESTSAWPHFIPFFNVAAGGARHGITLLGDSNIDWGQDLPLLAQWQREHPGRTLYLAYFGTADPGYYGIRYRNLPGGYPYGPEPVPTIPDRGVVAVSASLLQGVLVRGDLYRPFRGRRPTQILGGSIYLFDLGGDE